VNVLQWIINSRCPINSSVLRWLHKQDDDDDKSQTAAGREFEAAWPQTAKLRDLHRVWCYCTGMSRCRYLVTSMVTMSIYLRETAAYNDDIRKSLKRLQLYGNLINLLTFLADRTATQYDRLLAAACCPSVCLSVCPSVRPSVRPSVCDAVHCFSQGWCTWLKLAPACS